MKYKATLNKKEYKEFTSRIDELSKRGFNLPHTVEYTGDGEFKIEIITELDLVELDKLGDDDV